MKDKLARRRLFVTSVLLYGVFLVLAGPAGAAVPKPAPAPEATDGKLRIICFGAHPDGKYTRCVSRADAAQVVSDL